MRKLNMLIALAIGLTVPLSGQIYFEDFTGQAGLGATINGTSVIGPFTWSVDASQVSFGADPNTSYFKVISVPGEEVFEGRGLNNGEAVWRSPLINISGQGTVRARVDVVQPAGSATLEPQDYIRVSYILDGGPETTFAIKGFLADDFVATTPEQAGLSGQTLQIVIRVRNSGSGERHRFDKVRVETFASTPCPSINGAPVFISEFHYKNAPEFVEVSGLAGTDLSSYQIIFLNSGGATGMIDLSGILTDQANGMGAKAFFTSGLPNGKGGIVLFNTSTQQVIQFLSYGEDNANFSPNYALVKGLTPVYTGQELGNTPSSSSIQLTGTGFCPEDLTWGGPSPNSPGGINAGLILPIELTEFSAAPHNGGVRLSWRTASERDNDYMAVERSSDGYTFDEIGRVPGRGTTYEPEHYTFFDPAPLTGINYYRLRQVDFDGSVAYHGVVSVRIEDAAQGLRVFPTLAREQLNVRLAQTPLTEGVLQLIDLAGRVRRTIPWAPGQSQETIGLADLPPGAYLLRLQLRDYRETVRFVRF